MKDWIARTWHEAWQTDRLDSWSAMWRSNLAFLKVLGLFAAGFFIAMTLFLWVLWTIEYRHVWLVWVVNVVSFGALCWAASEIWHDRSDNKHMQREGWCPKCGKDYP